MASGEGAGGGDIDSIGNVDSMRSGEPGPDGGSLQSLSSGGRGTPNMLFSDNVYRWRNGAGSSSTPDDSVRVLMTMTMTLPGFGVQGLKSLGPLG